MSSHRAHGSGETRGAVSPRRAYARAAIVAAAAVAPTALWAPSCLLDGFERVPAMTTEEDAGVEPSVCTHVTYPPPPPPDTADAGAVDLSFTVALRTIDLGEDPASAAVGLDLDGTCTCLGEGPSCQPVYPDAGQSACDLNGGRDNVGTKLFEFMRTAFTASQFGSTFYSQQAEIGRWSVLMRVRHYNGQPDDSQVQLDWYVSPGLGGAFPVWDGNDQWPVQSDQAIGGDIDQPQFTDPAAYVTNYILVAGLPELPMRLGGAVSSIEVYLSGAFLMAEIGAEPDAGDASVLRQGTLVGRWTLQNLFRSIGSYRSETGEPYCTDDLFYSAAKQQLCARADILSKPGSPTATCDALSLGMAFNTWPAKIGGLHDGGAGDAATDVVIQNCPPETDPTFDSCEKP